MKVEELIRSMTPQVYENMKQAIELGRWPDGRLLAEGQREICMDAVIRYEIINDLPAEKRVGYISGGCKSEKKDDDIQPLNIQ